MNSADLSVRASELIAVRSLYAKWIDNADRGQERAKLQKAQERAA